jgi:hypothetical protein
MRPRSAGSKAAGDHRGHQASMEYAKQRMSMRFGNIRYSDERSLGWSDRATQILAPVRSGRAPVRSLMADTALNHCGQRARSSVRNEVAKEAARSAADVSARGWLRCSCLRGGGQGLIGQRR